MSNVSSKDRSNDEKEKKLDLRVVIRSVGNNSLRFGVYLWAWVTPDCDALQNHVVPDLVRPQLQPDLLASLVENLGLRGRNWNEKENKR